MSRIITNAREELYSDFKMVTYSSEWKSVNSTDKKSNF